MVAAVRRLALGMVFALLAAGAVAARDYIVVRSTDPAFVRGQSLDGGVRLKLGLGRTLTLMHASGDLVTLKGKAGVVVVPKRQADQTDAERLAVLKVMVAPTDHQVVGGARTRSGVCPAPASLTTLDAIVQVHRAGCAAAAAEALAAWLAAQPDGDA